MRYWPSLGVCTVRLGSELGKHRLEMVNAFTPFAALDELFPGDERVSSEQSDEHTTGATEENIPQAHLNHPAPPNGGGLFFPFREARLYQTSQ